MVWIEKGESQARAGRSRHGGSATTIGVAKPSVSSRNGLTTTDLSRLTICQVSAAVNRSVIANREFLFKKANVGTNPVSVV